MDVHKESISIAVLNAAGGGDGMRQRNQSQHDFCSLSTGCEEICRSPLRKALQPPGCTTC
jgi:hypothetical protein